MLNILFFFNENFVGAVEWILVKVNKKLSLDCIHPLSLSIVQEMDEKPPKIYPFSFYNKQIVGPLLSQFSWNFFGELPSLEPL